MFSLSLEIEMADKQELLERRGLRKMGGENSPISPPLDPRLARLEKEKSKNLLQLWGERVGLNLALKGGRDTEFRTSRSKVFQPVIMMAD